MVWKVQSVHGRRALVLMDQGLLSGFAFLTTLVLLRGMGLAGFGTYSLLALGWMWVLGLAQALLVQPMQTLLGSRTGARRAAYLAGCWRLALCFAGPMALLAGLAAWQFGIGAAPAWAFSSFLLARTLQMQLRTAAFTVGDRVGALVSDGIGQGGGFLAVLVCGFTMGWSLHGMLFAQAALWAAATIYSLARFEGRGHKPLPLGSMAARHWRFSRWLAGMAAVRWLSANAFLLAAVGQFGPASLAVLRGAQAIVGVANLGLAAMESVLPTGAALKAGSGGQAALFQYLRGFGLKAAAPVLLMVLGILLFADPLLGLVFGGHVPPQARGALVALAMLPATSLLYTLYSVAYRTLERTQQMFWVYGFVALLVSGIAPWVVRHFGLAGAAAGIALQPLCMALILAMALFLGNRKKAMLDPRACSLPD